MIFTRLLLLCLLAFASVVASAQMAVVSLLALSPPPLTVSIVPITLPTVTYRGTAYARLSAPAGPGGQPVRLSARTTRGISPVVTVRPRVLVPEGQTQALFAISPAPGAVLGNQYVITASILGGSSASESLGFTIPYVESVSVQTLLPDIGPPGYAYGGKTLLATVFLNAPALAPGLVVSVSDTSGSGNLFLPGTVTVPTGRARYSFNFGTKGVLALSTVQLSVQDGYGSANKGFFLLPPGVKRVSTLDTLVRVGHKVRLSVELDTKAAAGLMIDALSNSSNLTPDQPFILTQAGASTVTLSFTATSPGVARAGAHQVQHFREPQWSSEITIVE